MTSARPLARRSLILFVMLASLSRPSAASAQVSTALVQGQVVDETKAVLPGVSVTARNEETGLTRQTVTDQQGYFRISALQPGLYELIAELTGFTTVHRKGLRLTVGQEVTLNFQLQLVSLQETVTVTGESPLVEVSKTTLGTTINTQKLDELPLSGRNYLSLVTLAAGVTPGGGAAGLAQSGLRNSGRTGYVVDGVSQERNVFPAARGSLSPDSVQEFQVLTNMFSAEYGQAAGPIVNILTRSGTNNLHGRIGVFNRSNELDARDVFATGEAPFGQWWYVGNIGGPIIRDRIHYFGSFEGIRTDQTQIVTSPLAPAEVAQPFRQIKVFGKPSWQIGKDHHATYRYSIDRNTTDNSGVGGLNTIERATYSYRAVCVRLQQHRGQVHVLSCGSPARRQLWKGYQHPAVVGRDTPAGSRLPVAHQGVAQPQTGSELQLHLD
jgi:hypothetical protein